MGRFPLREKAEKLRALPAQRLAAGIQVSKPENARRPGSGSQGNSGAGPIHGSGEGRSSFIPAGGPGCQIRLAVAQISSGPRGTLVHANPWAEDLESEIVRWHKKSCSFAVAR